MEEVNQPVGQTKDPGGVIASVTGSSLIIALVDAVLATSLALLRLQFEGSKGFGSIMIMFVPPFTIFVSFFLNLIAIAVIRGIAAARHRVVPSRPLFWWLLLFNVVIVSLLIWIPLLQE